MTIISLRRIWSDNVIEEQRALLPDDNRPEHQKVMQSSFELPSGAKTVFVRDAINLERANNYTDLPKVQLTKDEKDIVANKEEWMKSIHSYNGDHILISDVLYDDEKNTVYIAAKQAPFSIISCLNQGRFSKDSAICGQDLYGAGALAPFVTQDAHTVLLESSKFGGGNYLPAAGFVQSKEDGTLNFQEQSLVELTAQEESFEEVLSDKNGNSRANIVNVELTSISFRKPKSGRGFVEFVAPVQLDCDINDLERILKTNVAPDAREHTGKYQVIPLHANNRKEADTWLKKDVKGGQDIYPSALIAASRVANRDCFGDLIQQALPPSRTRAIPAASLVPSPSKTISLLSDQKEEYKERE